MGRRPNHAKVPRSAVVAALAPAAATATIVAISVIGAIGSSAITLAQSVLADEEILAAARATSVAAIDTGQVGGSIVRSFDRFVPDAFTAIRGIELGDCGARSVAQARADDSGDLVCAIVRADLRSGGSAEVRFPISTGDGYLVDDRSLHFAGVDFGELERSFPSLEDFWSYVGNRANMLNYWPRSSHVVLAEIREIQYVRNAAGHPIIHHRGFVLRSFLGDWAEGDPIELVTSTEGRPETFDSADVVIPDPPRLQIAFLNENRAGPHYLDTGWLWPYGEMLSIALIVEDLARLAAGSSEAR